MKWKNASFQSLDPRGDRFIGQSTFELLLEDEAIAVEGREEDEEGERRHRKEEDRGEEDERETERDDVRALLSEQEERHRRRTGMAQSVADVEEEGNRLGATKRKTAREQGEAGEEGSEERERQRREKREEEKETRRGRRKKKKMVMEILTRGYYVFSPANRITFASYTFDQPMIIAKDQLPSS